MEQINTITVNGKTYNIGGTGSSTGGFGNDAYFISTSLILEGTSDSITIEEFDRLLGGNGDKQKVKELYEAAFDGKLIVFRNPDTNSIMIPSIITTGLKTTSGSLNIQFIYSKNTTFLFHNMIISNIAGQYFLNYKVTAINQS